MLAREVGLKGRLLAPVIFALRLLPARAAEPDAADVFGVECAVNSAGQLRHVVCLCHDEKV